MRVIVMRTLVTHLNRRLAHMQTCAQVLVTAESLASSTQYALAKQTFTELLRMGSVPVVNENVRSHSRAAVQHSAWVCEERMPQSLTGRVVRQELLMLHAHFRPALDAHILLP